MVSAELSYGGPWTKQKLEILKEYLDAFTTALKKQKFKLIYIDAFAGTGEVPLPKELIQGSTKIALEIDDKPFDRLLFIEKNPKRYKELLKLKEENTSRDIIVEKDEANKYLKQLCNDWYKNYRGWRGVLLLDPFSTDVEWGTIEAIAKTHSLDSFILFPVSSIARMLPINKQPEDIDKKWVDRLNIVFGGNEWKDLYEQSPQQSLFHEEKEEYRRDQGVDGIVNIYKQKLQQTFGERFINKTKTFYNSKNSPIFKLIFCVGHKNGITLAQRIIESIMEGRKT